MFDPSIDLAGIRKFQFEIRAAIRKSNLTPCEKEVALVLVNLWWGRNKNSYSARGLGSELVEIYPGVKRISKMSKTSRRTSISALHLMRVLGAVNVTQNAKGGNGAQRLLLCFHGILVMCSMSKSDVKSARDKLSQGCKKSPIRGAKVAHGLKDSILEKALS